MNVQIICTGSKKTCEQRVHWPVPMSVCLSIACLRDSQVLPNSTAPSRLIPSSLSFSLSASLPLAPHSLSFLTYTFLAAKHLFPRFFTFFYGLILTRPPCGWMDRTLPCLCHDVFPSYVTRPGRSGNVICLPVPKASRDVIHLALHRMVGKLNAAQRGRLQRKQPTI